MTLKEQDIKIGIFGDSFASLKFEENTTPTWVDILSEKYDITNHAISGSTLYYSIEEIKKHHTHYDKIILVVTRPGRLQVAKWMPLVKEDQFIQPVIVKFLNEYNLDKYQKLAWEAANQYYSYLQDTTYDTYIHNLMLKEIKEILPNIILIPSFLDSWNDVNHAMFRIALKENTAWGLGWKNILENYNDIRNCHMIAENNAIFAEKAEQWLRGEHVHINLDDFVTTTDKDFYLKQK